MPSPSPKQLKKDTINDFEAGMEGNLAGLENGLSVGDDFVFPSPPREVSVSDRDTGEVGGNTYLRNGRFIESYPGEAGNGLRQSKTLYEVWLQNQREEEKIPWFPFANEQEWELAKWLLKMTGGNHFNDKS